jgi:myosin heavy subunit
MEELNETLCAVIFGITNCSIDSIAQVSDGAYLPHILEKIDSDFFRADDPQLGSWRTVQERLEAFLEARGIKDRGLELPIQDLEEKDFDSLVSTLLQVLAIFVTFNKQGWDAVMKSLDFVTRTHITKLLDGMVSSLKQLVELSQKIHKFGSDELSLGFLLSKLEAKEDELEKKDAEIKKLQEQLSKEVRGIQQLKDSIAEKEKELYLMQELKEKAYEDLIKNQTNFSDDFADQKNADVIRELQKEISELKSRLAASQTSILDRDLEVTKLNSLIANLTVSHNQNEDLRRQLEHVESNMKQVRSQNEYLNSRLNSMSNVDNLIKNLNARLKEEKESSLRLQAQLEETQPHIEKMQKRIDILESQKRFASGQSGTVTEFSDLQTIELFRTLEFENQQYKKKMEELMAQNRSYEERLFSQSITEKENESLRAQIDAFLETGDLNVLKAPKNHEDSAGRLEFSEPSMKGGSAEKRYVSLEQLPTTDFSDGGVIHHRHPPTFGEFADVMYSTLMSFYSNELADQKKFVLPRQERERNILKQFMLTDMLQGE